MRYKIYHIRYAKTGEEFIREFTVIQYPYIAANDGRYGVPEFEALQLVNEWNRQNAVSGFTYWID